VLPFLASTRASKLAVVGLRLPSCHHSPCGHSAFVTPSPVAGIANCKTVFSRRIDAYLGHLRCTGSACLVLVFAASQGSNHAFLRLRRDQRTYSLGCPVSPDLHPTTFLHSSSTPNYTSFFDHQLPARLVYLTLFHHVVSSVIRPL